MKLSANFDNRILHHTYECFISGEALQTLITLPRFDRSPFNLEIGESSLLLPILPMLMCAPFEVADRALSKAAAAAAVMRVFDVRLSNLPVRVKIFDLST